MKKLLLITFPVLIGMVLNAQNSMFQWVKSNYGSQGTVTLISMDIDSMGNIYSVGSFTGTVDFNPSPTQTNWLTSINNGPSTFIQKLDSNGNLVWMRSLNAETGGLGYIKINPDGRLILIGSFSDSIDIDPGPTVYKLYSNLPHNVIILKLSAAGNFIWAKSFGDQAMIAVRDYVFDNQGNIYTTGFYEDTVDFDPGPGSCIYGAGYTIYNDPLANAFVQKLDANGNFVWAKAFLNSEPTGGSRGSSIDLDAQGNVFCRGFYSGSVDFDPGSGVSNLPGQGVYLVKLDSSGSFFWANAIPIVNGAGAINGTMDIEIDRDDNIYTIGRFQNLVDFDPGPDTLFLEGYNSSYFPAFIQKLDKNGNLLWAKSYGGFRYKTDPFSLTSDTLGNIYTTGLFEDSTDLDPGPDTSMFYTYSTFSPAYGTYLQKLNSNGNLLWAGILQGNLGGSSGYDISVDKYRNIFVAGNYGGTVDFDPGPGTYNQTQSHGSSFLVKLSQCHNLTTDYQTTCDSLVWMDSVTYYQSTQSAYFTLPGSTCDSVIVLNLNIPQIDTTVSIGNYGGSLTANQSGASYQWLDCGSGLSPLSGDTLQSFTPSLNGSYAVVVNVVGCVDTSACVSVSNAGLEETLENPVRLYPNPNSGKFILDLGSLHHAYITIINSMGQMVAKAEANTSHTIELDLPAGVYWVQIRTDKIVNTLRMVVR